MNIKNLLIGLDAVKAKGSLEKEIREIQNDSRKVQQGDLFVAIKGFVSDGHEYVQEVIEKGATAVMVQEGCIDLAKIQIPEEVTIIMVPDTKRD